MKKTILLIVIIVAALAVFSSVFVFDPFKLNLSLFKHELSIDKTANVVTQIKKISEFTTACYYEELVIQKDKYDFFERKLYKENASDETNGDIKQSSSAWNKLKGAASKAVKAIKHEDSSETNYDVVIDSTKVGSIVFIVKTKVRAGFDLSKIKEGDLVVKGDTLSIRLPSPEIFDIIANPSDWEIYHRKGDWTDEEIRAIQSGAKEDIRQDAIDYGILEKAEKFGHESMTSLFKTFGFAEVVLQK